MNDGWIKLHRPILDKALSRDPIVFSIWCYLLLSANFKPTEYIFKGRTNILQRGQLLTSIRKISSHFNINRNKVHRSLELLENDSRIETRKNSKFTIITITNYDKYQEVGHEWDTSETREFGNPC